MKKLLIATALITSFNVSAKVDMEEVFVGIGMAATCAGHFKNTGQTAKHQKLTNYVVQGADAILPMLTAKQQAQSEDWLKQGMQEVYMSANVDATCTRVYNHAFK